MSHDDLRWRRALHLLMAAGFFLSAALVAVGLYTELRGGTFSLYTLAGFIGAAILGALYERLNDPAPPLDPEADGLLASDAQVERALRDQKGAGDE